MAATEEREEPSTTQEEAPTTTEKVQTTPQEENVEKQDDPIEEEPEKNKNKRVSSFVGLLFIFSLLATFFVVFLIDAKLPTPLLIENEIEYPTSFIAERAQNDLRDLTNIGPRVTGTHENDVEAVELLKQKVDDIIINAHPIHRIEADLQIVSGSYDMENRRLNTLVYGNIQNIVVKFHAKEPTNTSLLVNAHFDSGVKSPGGSDDGINCAIMLEVLRKLAMFPGRLQHNIIFLFNGAEETGLQASHGFIMQHKWASEAKAVVNLEAAGAAGKIMLFQAGPRQPWLLKYYSKVPHPNSQVLGEELFQSGVIPSDTDFTIFHGHANLTGLDFAYVRNGYRYHTRFDGFHNIPMGTYQQAGETILSLVRNIANGPELFEPEGEGSGDTIFYDFFGLFLIHYTDNVGITINIITCVFSVVLALKALFDFKIGFNVISIVYIIITVVGIVAGWLLAGAFVTIIAIVIDQLDLSMSWYRNPWMVFGLYSAPVVAISCTSIVLFNAVNCIKKNKLTPDEKAQLQIHIVRLVWTSVLILLTGMRIRSAYLILFPIFFQIIGFLLIQFTSLKKHTAWKFVFVLSMVLPTMFLMQQSLTAVTFVIPILGRFGEDAPSEVYVAVITFFLTVLIASSFIPLILVVERPFKVVLYLALAFGVFFVLLWTPVAFAFSGNPDDPAAQRFAVTYTKTSFNTGRVYKTIGITREDRNGNRTIEQYIKPLTSEELEAIEPGAPVDVKLLSKTEISETIVQYNFTISGLPTINIRVAPSVLVSLSSLSFGFPSYTKTVNNFTNPYYNVLFIWGKETIDLQISVTVEIPSNWHQPSVELTVAGTYFHDENKEGNPVYTTYLQQFPLWSDTLPYLVTRDYKVY